MEPTDEAVRLANKGAVNALDGLIGESLAGGAGEIAAGREGFLSGGIGYACGSPTAGRITLTDSVTLSVRVVTVSRIRI